MLLIHDTRCAGYGSRLHPEQPTRVTETAERLRVAFPKAAWTQEVGDVPDETLLLAHTTDHLSRLNEPRDFDADTAHYPDIASHARRSVAAALAASRHARESKEPAFSMMRPPGHHALANQAMGFCYLNQVAVAALAARKDLGAKRVAVWDFDAHHGNGTEAILRGRDGFLYCSVHQAPCFPGTGLRSMGNTLNWPVAPRSPRKLHMEALRRSLDAIVDFRPDLVLVSAGFDAFVGDPITEMTLEYDDFGILGAWLRETGLPAASVLEGGYSPELPVLIEVFLAAWAA